MKPINALRRMATADGWTVSRTRGDHLRLEHPEAKTVVFASSTPSCRRALANTLALMRKALRQPAATEEGRRP